MKALRIKEVGKLELMDMEIPKVTPHHVLLKVNAASICGTDLHEVEGNIPVTLPRIPGHDFSGTVMEAGPGVKKFKAGDAVAVKPSFPCYHCDDCNAGLFGSCPDTKLIGLHMEGCFREMMLVPEANLIPIPKGVSFEAASVLEPFTVALNAFMKLKINVGESVTILGQGPIGLGVTRIAALSGAGSIYAVDVREDVLAVAKQYGATVTVNMSKEDGKKKILDLSGGGTDVVIEAAGSSATVAMLPELVKKEGKLVTIGTFAGIGSIRIEALVMKALTVIGVGGNGGKGRYERALDLTAKGVINPMQMVTNQFPLTDAIQAFEIAGKKPMGTIKVVVINK